MLSWLSGAPPADNYGDYTETSVMQSQPETPAHVFAARAFKYRLWGTPKPDTTQARPRRRTQSADRAQTRNVRSDDFLASPAKPNGILLTPGTTNLRRSKTVTFPAQYHEDGRRDNGLRPTHTAFARQPFTAKAPSPPLELPPSTGKRSAFTERLRDARTTKPAESKAPSPPAPAQDPTDEFRKTTQTVTTTDTTDWKTRYESYAARTEREMRKLITKQQAAKHFAREADERASTLTAELAAERTKAAALGSRVDALSAEVARLKAELASRPGTLEERFSVLRTSPARPRPQPNEDTWLAAAAGDSTPSRAPLEPKRASFTPMQTPPRSRGRTPRRAPAGEDIMDKARMVLREAEDKENAGAAQSPRRMLDAERRAAAAARIAARRREKALLARA